jgi:hypothetical protein
MFSVDVNPSGIKETYIKCLNTCFHDWGGAESFDWCFARRVANRIPDLLVLRDTENIVAGSGITYRRLQMNARTLEIACMTGSWTLPQARNRGCFGQMVEASRAVACDRGCSLLLAHVTAGNSSCRSLISAGSYLLPSAYVSSSAPPNNARGVGIVEEVPYQEAQRDRGIPEGHVHYQYEPDEWAGQFIRRPRPIRTFRVNGSAIAVVEMSGGYDRVLQLTAADSRSYVAAMTTLWAASAEHGRKLFAFTVAEALISLMEPAGFNLTRGYVTALPTEVRMTPQHERDKASQSEQNRASSKDWPFGQWWIANGDRM